MIVDTWQIAVLIVLALGCVGMAYVIGREDWWRRRRALRAVWRAEMREEIRGQVEAEMRAERWTR